MTSSEIDRVFISVSNMEASLAFYRDWIGMEVVADSPLASDEIQRLWNLSEHTKARAVSLKNEQQQTLLELIEFQPNSGKMITDLAQPGDYGIYSIAFMVSDLDRTYKDLKSKGFTFISSPITYKPDWSPYEVKQVILIGPDKVPIAHFERMISPKEEIKGDYGKFTHSAQIIEDMNEVARFYRDILGVDLLMELTITKGLVDELLSLPTGTEGKIAFFKKQDSDSLLMEFLQLSIKGRSLASVAKPPNIGLFMLSFKVDDLTSLMRICKKEKIRILSGPVELYRERTGKMRALTVEGPGGTMIELFDI